MLELKEKREISHLLAELGIFDKHEFCKLHLWVLLNSIYFLRFDLIKLATPAESGGKTSKKVPFDLFVNDAFGFCS